jgi:hypothetical protein
VGVSDSVKLCVAEEFTMSDTVVLLVVEPEVPVTVTLKVPGVVAAEALKVRVELTLPFTGGVTGLGANDAVTPDGSPVALSAMAALNPFRLVAVTVAFALAPWVTLTDEGEAPIVKSGVVELAVQSAYTFAVSKRT